MKVIKIKNRKAAHRTIGTERFREDISIPPGATVAVDAELWERVKQACPAVQGMVNDETLQEVSTDDATAAEAAVIDAAKAKAEAAAKDAAEDAREKAKTAAQKAADAAAIAASEAERIKAAHAPKADTKPETKGGK